MVLLGQWIEEDALRVLDARDQELLDDQEERDKEQEETLAQDRGLEVEHREQVEEHREQVEGHREQVVEGGPSDITHYIEEQRGKGTGGRVQF